MSKLTEEELTNIKEIQDKYSNTVIELGKCEVDLIFLNSEIEQVETKKSIYVTEIRNFKNSGRKNVRNATK